MSWSPVPCPSPRAPSARLGHVLEQVAFALGRAEALAREVSPVLWDQREAVWEARLGGATLSLAELVAAETGDDGVAASGPIATALGWLAALRELRTVPTTEPVLSPSHWRAAVARLEPDHGPRDGRDPGLGSLRRLWFRHGGLGASSRVAAAGLHRTPGLAVIGRLAAHALLHHAGLAVAAVAPVAAATTAPAAPPTDAYGTVGPLRSLSPGVIDWLRGLLRGVEERQAVTQLLREQVARDADRVSRLPRCAESTLVVLAQFQRTPVATITSVSQAVGLCFPTALRATQRLQDYGVVREMTGRRSGRVFAYEAYLRLLEPAGAAAEGQGRQT